MTRFTKPLAFLLPAAAMFGVAAGALAETPADDDASKITFSKPAEKQPGCFADSMRLTRDLMDRLPKLVHVQFTVREDGAIDAVSAEGASPALATQIRGALSRCSWTSAADDKGVPMSVAVRLPVRFDIGSSPGAAPTAVASLEEASVTPVALAQR
jgi:hypothetical protein